MPRKATNVPAKKKETLPAVAAFKDVANVGMENVTADDLLVPRLNILQGLSPQLKKSDSNYIPEAEEGDIINTATKSVVKDILFIPCKYEKKWLEWFPREQAKGIAKIHNDKSILAAVDDNFTLPDGNEVNETAHFYGFVYNPEMDAWTECFIAMTSSQLKKARAWITMAREERFEIDGKMLPAPLFYRAYHLSTAEEKNPKGQWFGWKVERGELIQDIFKDNLEEMIAGFSKFAHSIDSGVARADFSDEDGNEGDDGGEEAL